MPRQVKRLGINEPDHGGQSEALNLIAARAGFPSYQRLTVHIWNRLIAEASEKVNTYPTIDKEIKAIVDRAAESLAALGKRTR